MTSKNDHLRASLATWTSIESLCATLGWKPHTTRAAISRLDVQTERKRENGVTSYRVKPAEAQDAA